MAAGIAFVLALVSQGFWTGGFAESAAARVRVTDDPSTRLAIARTVGEFLARDVVQASALALALAVAGFAFVVGKLRPLAFALVVLALGALDYYRVDRYILHPETFRRHDGYRIIRDKSTHDAYARADESIEFLRAREGEFRVLPLDGLDNLTTTASFMSNRYMIFDIASVGGYHPAKLSVYDEFLRAVEVSIKNWQLHLVDMMGARYFVSSVRLPDHPSLTPVWVGDNYDGNPRAIYENAGAFPRAWVAGDYVVASGDAALVALAEGRVDLRQTVVLEAEPAIRPEPGDSAHVTVVRSEARRVELAVTLTRPGIVVVSDAYYPDWKASVDGTAATILKANYAFRALALPAGTHRIEMHYDDGVLRKGATVSVIACALAVLAIVGSLVRARKGRGWKRSS
jgi:hypothetical protein